MKEQGVEIVEVDKALFEEVVKPVVDKFLSDASVEFQVSRRLKHCLSSMVISFTQWSMRSFYLWSAFLSSCVFSSCQRLIRASTLTAIISSHCSLVVFFMGTPPSANTISDILAEIHIHIL